MTSSIHNFELQGAFRNWCQIIWGWAVNVTAQIRHSIHSHTNAVNTAVKVRTFFPMETPRGKFQCAKMCRWWSFL